MKKTKRIKEMIFMFLNNNLIKIKKINSNKYKETIKIKKKFIQ